MLRWMRKAILKLRDEILKKKKKERGLGYNKKRSAQTQVEKMENCLVKGKKCKQQCSGQKS